MISHDPSADSHDHTQHHHNQCNNDGTGDADAASVNYKKYPGSGPIPHIGIVAAMALTIVSTRNFYVGLF